MVAKTIWDASWQCQWLAIVLADPRFEKSRLQPGKLILLDAQGLQAINCTAAGSNAMPLHRLDGFNWVFACCHGKLFIGQHQAAEPGAKVRLMIIDPSAKKSSVSYHDSIGRAAVSPGSQEAMMVRQAVGVAVLELPSL